MSNIQEFLTEDHRRCDHQLTDAENAVNAKNWPQAAELFSQFRDSMERHLRMEEERLFPAIEVRTGGPIGPTMMMRHEHEQMRELLNEIAGAIRTTDGKAFLGASETLMMLVQQHNMKEEQILYPMADQMLEDELSTVMDQMKAIHNVDRRA